MDGKNPGKYLVSMGLVLRVTGCLSTIPALDLTQLGLAPWELATPGRLLLLYRLGRTGIHAEWSLSQTPIFVVFCGDLLVIVAVGQPRGSVSWNGQRV